MSETQILMQLRQTSYMKLLKFAASNAGKTFTPVDANRETGVPEDVFLEYVGDLFVEDMTQRGTFRMALPAVFQYIQFAELQHAVASAADAKKESATSFKVAVLAILVSTIFAGLQVYLQAFGTTNLNDKQFSKLVDANKPVELAINKLSISQADAANKLLQQNIESAQKFREAHLELIGYLKKPINHVK